MIIGVLSAEQVKVNIGGSVSFNATNVYAKVSGNISRAKTGNKTFSTLTYSAEETTGNESDWTNLALEFTETPDPIVITITVENLSTQRTLTVNLENTLQGEGLDIAVTSESDSYTSGTNVELPVSTGDGSSTTTFTLTLTVANPDQSLTDVNFGYILNMYDESVASALPTPASSFTFSYSDADQTASITKFVGSETEVVIPSTVEYNGTTYTVTSIVSSDGLATGGAFFGSNITSVVIPDSVTRISNFAFYNSNLPSITIPDSVASIGNSAFQSCDNLTSITIGEGVASIGSSAFSDCINLTSVDFGENSQLTRIGDDAFSGCGLLTSITIPDSVITIGDSAFFNCSALAEVYNYSSLTITEGSYSNDGDLGRYAKVVYNASELTGEKPETRITVVDKVQYYNYGDDFIALAPISRNVTEVTLDNRTTKIEIGAFSDCGLLTSITIPASVTTIGNNAFHYCYALAEVYNYSPSITVNLGETSSSNNGYLGQYAKVVYNARDLSGGKPETRIRDYNGVRYYDDGKNTVVALYPLSKDITTVSLDSRTTEIQPNAFYGCRSLTSITIPEGVTSIGTSAFRYCSSLTSITIPERVTRIRDYTFYECSNLTSITIPNTVTSIGFYAFAYCYALAEVYNYSPSITVNLGETSSSNNGYLGQYAKVVYNARDLSGGKPETRIRDYNGVRYYDDGENTVVALYAISKDITTVSLDSRTTEINQYAFNGCSSLTSITIPESVKSIGDNAFRNCKSLTSVGFRDNSQLTSIGDSAFEQCSSLTSITIPDGVTSIGGDAFYQCSSLNEVTVESDNIYLALTSQSACGRLINYITSTGETVKVLKSVVDSVDPDFTVNTYLNGSRFTRSVSEDGLYYVYTRN